MKLKAYIPYSLFARIAAALLLPFAVILVSRMFGYDVFDRGGWAHGIDGSLRYLSYEGEAQLGWQEIEEETYYFSPDKGIMATGWLELENGRYFLQENGIRTTGWTTLEEKRYYFAEDGLMATGWQEIQQERYYFHEDGVAATGWQETPQGRYYLREDGTMATGWLETEQGTFYLDENGQMRTGWFETERGLCYLSETGAITSGWVDTDKGRAYIDEDGSVHTGWLELDEERYFLTEEGILHTGWLDLEDDRYYFLDDGAMAVGEVIIDGEARHFASTGKNFVLVNRWNRVPKDYAADLVYVQGFQIDRQARDELVAMMADCEAAGFPCEMTSAYRGYNYQNTLFQRKVKKLLAQGYTQAAAEQETSRSIAIPGTSEHQLGLAVDLKNGFSTYAWLGKNCWKYGFILRYPNGTTSLTGIYYEPWHYRYVGKELAKELHDLGICLEAYVDMLTEKEK